MMPDNAATPERFAYGWPVAVLALTALAAGLALSAYLAGFAAEWHDSWTGVGQPRAYSAGELESLSTARLAVFLLTFQLVSLAAVSLAIAAFKRPGVALAPFAIPAGGLATIARAAVALLAMAAVYGAAVYVIDSDAFADDVRPFAGMIRTDAWLLLALAAVFGAPVTEELAFRGFAFGVLSASPAGPRVAAVVTAALWAGLHASYSVYGMLAIFLIGLYFAWLRLKTGSLAPSIVCHALYNAIIVAALASAPDDAFAP